MNAEERRRARNEYLKAWRQTPAGQACLARQRAAATARIATDPAARAARAAATKKHRQTEKGRKAHIRNCVKTRRKQRARNLSRARITLIWSMASKACPPYLPPDMRDDIIADILAGVFAGEYAPRDVPKAAKAIITANRRHNSKFGPISLDAPQFEDGAPLIESITTGMWG